MNGIEDLKNAMRLEAQRSAGRLAMPRVGIISGYDNSNGVHNVKVQYPEDTDANGNPLETGWIPNAPIWSGGGWGLYVGPVMGQQVVVSFIAGSPNHGYVSHHLPSRQATAPQVPSGEFWLVHSSGSSIKIVTSGAINLQDAQGSQVNLANNGNITVSCSQTMNVTSSNNITMTAPNITLDSTTVNITGQVLVTGGPIKVNGVTVIVP